MQRRPTGILSITVAWWVLLRLYQWRVHQTFLNTSAFSPPPSFLPLSLFHSNSNLSDSIPKTNQWWNNSLYPTSPIAEGYKIPTGAVPTESTITRRKHRNVQQLQLSLFLPHFSPALIRPLHMHSFRVWSGYGRLCATSFCFSILSLYWHYCLLVAFHSSFLLLLSC